MADPRIDACFQGTQGDFKLDCRFTVPAKGVTALFGPSGCGKTTVLRCIAGLNNLDGHFRIGQQVWQDGRFFKEPHKRAVGYVFQEASLFDHLSVPSNLTYGRKRALKAGRAKDAAVSLDDVVGLLGLERLMDRPVSVLSGGERQRVAIGRALLSEPEVLLMDEPLSALDRFAKDDILPYLERLHDELSIPVFYVSHDIAEVERLADTLVLMKSGGVEYAGPLAPALTDPGLPLSSMVGAASVLEGTVVDYNEHYGMTTLSVGGAEVFVAGGRTAEPGQRRRLRILASDIALCRQRAPEGSSINNALPARILVTEPFGDFMVTVHLKLGPAGKGDPIIARLSRKSYDRLNLQPGETVIALMKAVAFSR
ncbi:MAG: molybdenum ABC transporter ATP-binding protein [Magnetovibrionaceae bacterium]